MIRRHPAAGGFALPFPGELDGRVGNSGTRLENVLIFVRCPCGADFVAFLRAFSQGVVLQLEAYPLQFQFPDQLGASPLVAGVRWIAQREPDTQTRRGYKTRAERELEIPAVWASKPAHDRRRLASATAKRPL